MSKRLPIPHDRLPALRGREATRALLSSHDISPSHLIMPLLITEEDRGKANQIPSLTLVGLKQELQSLRALGIKSVKLFAASSRRSNAAGDSVNKDNLMIRAINTIKDACPDMCVMTEVCLCSYTSDGSCFLKRKDGKTELLKSCELIARAAVLHADHGADIVGPAAMLPMSVRMARDALNANGHYDVSIMPHVIVQSALYSLYRRTMKIDADNYQKGALQIHNTFAGQSVDFAQQMVEEGADMLLMEPALFVLDVLAEMRVHFRCPLAAFSVSGEYDLLESARAVGADYRRMVLLEFATAVRRAGADLIMTYAAKELAEHLVQSSV
jgi:porphobilinogen synthase